MTFDITVHTEYVADRDVPESYDTPKDLFDRINGRKGEGECPTRVVTVGYDGDLGGPCFYLRQRPDSHDFIRLGLQEYSDSRREILKSIDTGVSLSNHEEGSDGRLIALMDSVLSGFAGDPSTRIMHPGQVLAVDDLFPGREYQVFRGDNCLDPEQMGGKLVYVGTLQEGAFYGMPIGKEELLMGLRSGQRVFYSVGKKEPIPITRNSFNLGLIPNQEGSWNNFAWLVPALKTHELPKHIGKLELERDYFQQQKGSS